MDCVIFGIKLANVLICLGLARPIGRRSTLTQQGKHMACLAALIALHMTWLLFCSKLMHLGSFAAGQPSARLGMSEGRRMPP